MVVSVLVSVSYRIMLRPVTVYHPAVADHVGEWRQHAVCESWAEVLRIVGNVRRAYPRVPLRVEAA